MDDTDKNSKKNTKATSPPKEGGEAKETDFKLSKKQSYADNSCLLKGIDLGRVIDFNKGLPISISRPELEIQGAKFNEAGELIYVPYRWMEVSNGS
jgi:hypothetical protein